MASQQEEAAKLRNDAIHEIRSGNQEKGRQWLEQAVELNPNDEHAWLWLSSVVSATTDKRRCLERVLSINPASEAAKRGLAKLPPAAPDAPSITDTQATEPVARKPAPSTFRHRLAAVAAIIVLLLFFVAAAFYIEPFAKVRMEALGVLDRDVYRVCVAAMKSRVPSTTDFASLGDSRVDNLGGDGQPFSPILHRVITPVEGENAFGARVKNHMVCNTRYTSALGLQVATARIMTESQMVDEILKQLEQDLDK